MGSSLDRSDAKRSLLLLAVFSLAALAVQSVNLDAAHYMDDYQYLLDASRRHSGRYGAAEYVFRPQNEHSMPFWRAWYYGCWRLFGLDPRPWHVVVISVHLASAWLLYIVLVRCQGNHLAPAAAAALWASICFGSWDNPLTLICASHFSLSLLWLLGAMVCIAHARSEKFRFWTTASFVLTSLALTTMGSMLLALPGMLLQYLLFERNEAPKGATRAWAISIFASVLVIGALEVAAIQQAQNKNDLSQLPHVGVVEAVHRAGEVYAIAFGNMAYWSTESGSTDAMIAKTGLSVGSFVLACLLGGVSGRRVMGVFLAASFPMTLAASLARRFIDTDQFLSVGKYRFLPMLWWCVVFGVLIEGAGREMGMRRRGLLVFVGVVLAAMVGHQFQNARRTRAVFDKTVAQPNAAFAQISQVLADCSRIAEAQSDDVVMPDLTVNVLTIDWRLSDVRDCVFPGGLPRLRFVPTDRLTPQEKTKSLAAVRTSQSQIAKGIESLIVPLADESLNSSGASDPTKDGKAP